MIALLMGPIFWTAAHAQDYPARPVRLLVGFSAGGGIDIMARVFAQQLAKRLGGSFYVENRLGASGNLAGGAVARAAPDGYTLLMAPIAYTLNPAFDIPAVFDPLADLSPVTLIAAAPSVLIINSAIPAATVPEFVAYVKANPGKLNYAAGAQGTSTHVAVLLFLQTAGLDMVHVPYRTAGEALTDVMRGDVAMYAASVPAMVGLGKSDQVRPLAATGTTRSPVLPNIPTVAESGIPYEFRGWYGMLAPKGTPKAITDKLRDAIVESFKDPGVLERLATDGSEPVGSTAEEFGALLKREIDTWKSLFKKPG